MNLEHLQQDNKHQMEVILFAMVIASGFKLQELQILYNPCHELMMI